METLWEGSSIFVLRGIVIQLTRARQFFAQRGLETRKGSSPANMWKGSIKITSEIGTSWLWGDRESYEKKEVNSVKAEREDGFGHYQVSQNSIIRNMGEVNEQWLPGKQFTPSCQVFKSFMCCRLIVSYLLSLWIKLQASWGDVLPCPSQIPTVRQSTLHISMGYLSSASPATPYSRKSLVVGFLCFFLYRLRNPRKSLPGCMQGLGNRKSLCKLKQRYKILPWKSITMPCLESKVRNVSDFDKDYCNTYRKYKTEVGTVL